MGHSWIVPVSAFSNGKLQGDETDDALYTIVKQRVRYIPNGPHTIEILPSEVVRAIQSIRFGGWPWDNEGHLKKELQ